MKEYRAKTKVYVNDTIFEEGEAKIYLEGEVKSKNLVAVGSEEEKKWLGAQSVETKPPVIPHSTPVRPVPKA